MGLDIFTNNMNQRVGRYSRVHSLRLDMVFASITYLDQFPGCKSSSELSSFLKSCTYEDKTYAEPKLILNNNRFSKYKDYNYELLKGLFIWVDHSDCDGSLSPDDSIEILSTLKHIYSFMDKDYFNDSNIKLENFYLYDILKDSSDNNLEIYFG
tara:strand:- start:1149 stop:1610 length:462 start_codon:yes stop_codon:yes gene_type:complete